MNRNKQQVPVIGGSSLLVIFAVLCLTVFALLGFSTVQADKRLSDISAEAVSDYYAADCQAEEIFALLRSGQIPDDVSTDGNVAICHGGKLQIVGYGTCKITAEYKGVKAECIIRVIAR